MPQLIRPESVPDRRESDPNFQDLTRTAQEIGGCVGRPPVTYRRFDIAVTDCDPELMLMLALSQIMDRLFHDETLGVKSFEDQSRISARIATWFNARYYSV